jgi:very-short-patch-repair endonuclease
MKNKLAFKKEGMFNEANPLVFELAKDLRRNMTDAEIILWNCLKTGINGLKFRRQHPIGIYIADFYCHKLKLIIEVDGSIHNKKEVKDYDVKRENDLKSWGYNITRFLNNHFLKDRESVLVQITSTVDILNKSSKKL